MNLSILQLKLLGKKVALAFLMFTFCRISFYLFNSEHFNNVSIADFFYGLRFDLVSLSYLLAPLTLFQLLPLSANNTGWYQKILKWLFYFPLILGIAINCVDIGYFQYTLKRTTFDFFDMVGTGDDFWKLLPNYIIDFWYAYVVFAVLIWLTFFLYKRCCKQSEIIKDNSKKSRLIQSTVLLTFIFLLVIGMRGGFQYRPIDIVNAGQYTNSQNTPLVLNTPFTLIKTMLVSNLEPVNYFDDTALNNIYQPVQEIKSINPLGKKNVVFIIMESYAKEYVGFLNNGKGYTPFLDSLMAESYVFTNAYANGQRSIESLPGIFAGLPQLMSTPYSVSSYANNKLDGLPSILKQNGYQTSFYHGGANGTMGFNGFVGSLGVDEYYGMDEYPNKEKDYDGKWGIFDEPYLQYFAMELNSKKEPFFSSVFTLSSHHPYPIPSKYVGRFPKGNLPIHETIGYSDYALKKFFKKAQSMSWFNNTIFVITPDHSSLSESAYYKSNLNRFAVPIIIYASATDFKGTNSSYFQQIDIMPTILDLLGINTTVGCFGISAFSDTDRFVVNYVNGNYQFASGNYFLVFDGTSSIGFYDLKKDSLLSENLINQLTNNQLIVKNKMETKLQAVIQQYNNRLISNQLSLSN